MFYSKRESFLVVCISPNSQSDGVDLWRNYANEKSLRALGLRLGLGTVRQRTSPSETQAARRAASTAIYGHFIQIGCEMKDPASHPVEAIASHVDRAIGTGAQFIDDQLSGAELKTARCIPPPDAVN